MYDIEATDVLKLCELRRVAGELRRVSAGCPPGTAERFRFLVRAPPGSRLEPLNVFHPYTKNTSGSEFVEALRAPPGSRRAQPGIRRKPLNGFDSYIASREKNLRLLHFHSLVFSS